MGRSRAMRTRGGKAASASEVAAEAGVSTRKRKAASASEVAAEAGVSTRKRKAASASSEVAAEAGGSTRKRKAASASEVAAEAGVSTRKRKAASASEAGGSTRKRKEAGDSGVSTSEERKILRLKKEEDRKILRLKKEEGKILQLKKVANAANDEAMAKLPAAYQPIPTVKKAVEPAGKKKKTVLVKRLVAQEQIDALLAMPCPITPNELTEEQLAGHPKSFQDLYNQEMDIAKKLRDYHQALVDQYFKYGYAVDESEAEVTDDEDGDDAN